MTWRKRSRWPTAVWSEKTAASRTTSMSIFRVRAGAARPTSRRWKGRSCAICSGPATNHQTCEAVMNTAIRNIRLDRDIASGDFRDAMRHLVGGVSVITVGRGRDISGMTVTSVSSLSVDPPSLIVTVNRSWSAWPLLKRYGCFGANLLAADQLDIAEQFSGRNGLKGADRFSGARWT